MQADNEQWGLWLSLKIILYMSDFTGGGEGEKEREREVVGKGQSLD